MFILLFFPFSLIASLLSSSLRFLLSLFIFCHGSYPLSSLFLPPLSYSLLYFPSLILSAFLIIFLFVPLSVCVAFILFFSLFFLLFFLLVSFLRLNFAYLPSVELSDRSASEGSRGPLPCQTAIRVCLRVAVQLRVRRSGFGREEGVWGDIVSLRRSSGRQGEGR